MIEQLYSLSSASKKLDVSVKTVRRLIFKYSIDTFKVGSRLRIKESDLRQMAIKTYNLEDIIDETF